MTMAGKTRADLLKRLEPYWKMEAANVVFVPLMLVFLSKGQLGWVSLAPMAATMVLLVIGALYWRVKVRQLRGQSAGFEGLLKTIAAWQWPSLVLTLAGCAAALAGWLFEVRRRKSSSPRLGLFRTWSHGFNARTRAFLLIAQPEL